MIRTFAGRAPRIDKTAFIHDSAEIIGRVAIGPRASIWPMAVLRGDVDAVRIGEGSNVQDLVAVHCRKGFPAVVGKGVTVGHSAIVHGARIGDGCLIGMGAVVMECELGRECLVAAGAMVLSGLKAPARSLVMGFPARVVRRLKPRELAHIGESWRHYMALAEKHRKSSRVLF